MNRFIHRPVSTGDPMASLVTVRDGRHPLVVLTMAACVIAGVMGMFFPPSKTSAIDRFLPDPWRCIYYALLLISGIIVSVAIWLPDLRDRLLWERIGLLPFTGVLLVYPLALVYVAPAGSLPLGTVFAALFGVGGLWRIISINGDLRRWRSVVQELRTLTATTPTGDTQ